MKDLCYGVRLIRFQVIDCGPSMGRRKAAAIQSHEKERTMNKIASGRKRIPFYSSLFFGLFFGFFIQAQDNQNCALIGRLARGPCFAVDIVNGTAFIGNGAYLKIVDFEEPANPVESGTMITPSVELGIEVAGGYAYIADSYGGLRIVDVSDLENPVQVNPEEVGYYDTGDTARQVSMSCIGHRFTCRLEDTCTGSRPVRQLRHGN